MIDYQMWINGRRNIRRLARLVAMVVLASVSFVMLSGAARLDAAETVGPTRQASGLQVSVGRYRESFPVPSARRPELVAAEQLVERWPGDFGPAWYDPSTGGVVLDTATPLGVALATAALAGDLVTFALLVLANPVTADISLDKLPVGDLSALWLGSLAGTVSQRGVARSINVLNYIRDDLTTLESQFGLQDNIWMSRLDPPNNRVIMTADTLSGQLSNLLVARYGAGAVLAEVLQDVDHIQPIARWNDNSPFWGGSRLTLGCTDAFSWVSGYTRMMLTAGHCISQGGYVSTPYESMGTVASGSQENWGSTGTQFLSEGTTYRGDMALISIYSSKSSSGYIYVGNSESGTGAHVAGMMSGRSQVGDEVCTGGSARQSNGSAGPGEICGWVVNAARINYEKEPGVWWRNVVTTESRQGWCNRPGDSGAPVYLYGSNGVLAQGILDGASGGGSDYFGGYFDQCRILFTDIWDAYYGFPGVIKT